LQTDYQTRLENLTRINLDDMLVSLGWQNWKMGRSIARIAFRVPARRLAGQVLEFDNNVSHLGLNEGSRQILPAFVNGLLVAGQENIPRSGPLLVLSNHPGLADSLAMFSALPRLDVKVVSADRPFLRALPAVNRYLIYVPEQNADRLQVIRSMLDVLRRGETLLTYPAGQIEPDPGVIPGAVEALADWSESIAIPVRMVPEVNIVVAVVSHVLVPQATYHPLTRLRRQKKDRERLGAAIQLAVHTLFPKIWPVITQITFTPPLPGADLAVLHEPRAITQAIVDFARPYVAAASQV
jgi:1-acyl-sn-glycerol-3-phosphate acyltransferase